jgi:3-dehydroquinate dehydratase-1
LRSKCAVDVAHLAAHFDKACVLSFHDFEKTPPLAELEKVIADAEKLGGLTKIATMIKSENDVDVLKALLKAPRRQPLCVIGMGESWTRLRVELAELGSCLAYGYLDSSAAPGQVSAATLFAALRR